MFGYFGATDVDVVTDCFDLLEAGFEDAQLARQVSLAIATKQIERRVNVLKKINFTIKTLKKQINLDNHTFIS